MLTNASASRSFRCVAVMIAGDAGVERELQDHAPHRRRRRLHGVHQPRRRPVQQDADHQKRKIDDVE